MGLGRVAGVLFVQLVWAFGVVFILFIFAFLRVDIEVTVFVVYSFGWLVGYSFGSRSEVKN